MTMDETIKRINELYHKSQAEGLTEEEKEEQKELRQKYIVETNAVPDYITLIASDEFMKERTPEEQKIIRKAAEIAQQMACDAADEGREKCKKMLEDDGMKIQTLNEKTWKDMQKASEPVYENIKKKTGDRLFELYSEGAKNGETK